MVNQTTRITSAAATKVKTRTLDLKREVIRNPTDQLLTSQGWSLWTCDEHEGTSGAE